MPRVSSIPNVDHDMREILDGYLDCALWSSTVDEEGHVYGDSAYSIGDIDHESLHFVEEEVRAFVTANFFDCAAYCATRPADHLGHDLWLTRNRHGAGFWDRGLGALGDRLTEACRPLGESDIYAIDADTFGVS